MYLKKIEMETIMLFNDAEKEAEIYTCNRALQRRVDKFCINYPDVFSMVHHDQFSKTYKCPKKHIRVSKPRKKA
jgi:hypothetical protein